MAVRLTRTCKKLEIQHIQWNGKETKLTNVPFELLECSDNYSKYGNSVVMCYILILCSLFFKLKLREVQSMVSQLDHEPFSSLSLPSQHCNSQSPQPPPSHYPSLLAHVSSERGVVSQIVYLIEEELTYPFSSGLTTTAQCPCCSGQLIVVWKLSVLIIIMLYKLLLN